MNATDDRHDSWRAVGASIGTAALFETLTVAETQSKTIWSASPWREDPAHTVLDLSVFFVPMLALTIGVRFLARRAPGKPHRLQQAVRAAAVMNTIIGFTLACEWAALIGTSRSGRWVTAQIGGLALSTVLTAASSAGLLKNSPQRVFSGPDLMADLVYLGQRLTWLQPWATPRHADWVRTRAAGVFIVFSMLVAAVITATQAVGERVTDPLFIAWLFSVETAANFTFCLVGNAVLGFLARPPRSRSQRIIEPSLATGCLATLTAVALHDPLWATLSGRPLTAMSLEVLTLAVGFAAFLIAAAVFLAASRESDQP